MKYYITLGHPSRDHKISQYSTGDVLRKIGFAGVKWNMATGRRNGDSLHRWYAEGDSKMILILQLTADVEKVEEIS